MHDKNSWDYSLGKFQVYNILLLIIVTMLPLGLWDLFNL